MGQVLDDKLYAHINDPVKDDCLYIHNLFLRGEINDKELQVYLADIFLWHVKNLSPQKMPLKPSILINLEADKKTSEWTRKGTTEKNAVLARVFSREHVKDYLEQCVRCVSSNVGDMKILERHILLWLEMDESDKAKECWDKYHEYGVQVIPAGVLHKSKTVPELEKEEDEHEKKRSMQKSKR